MNIFNRDLANIFEEMGSIYEFLGEENRFRAIAYHNAARSLNDLSEDIRNLIHDKKFDKVPGLGKSTQLKILEYIKSHKIKKHEELKKRIPKDFIELLHVQGLGPQTLKKLYKEIKVSTREDLIRVCEDGTLLKLKGFKKKKVENILNGLRQRSDSEVRVKLWDAIEQSDELIERLKKLPEIKKIDVAGSVRRKKETIGDIDILIAAADKDRKKIIRHFIEMEDVSKVLAEGETKVSIFMEHFNKQIDLRIIAEDEWGAAMQYFTGSKAHNIHLRKIAIDHGLKINEYGVFNVKNNKKVAGKTEEEIYEILNMQWMPPELREDTGEIELSIEGEIPKLVTLKDIKGDMHTHSRWSDGKNTLEEIAQYAQRYLKYDYLVITDHSKSERIAGGMDEEEFKEQIKKIKEINKKLGKEFLKAGAEVDILADGSLDLSDDLLKQLDWVVASVHSQFKRDNTERIIKACENPYVNVIGHPTGRRITIREGYIVDLDRVIEAAKLTGTALEINAHAERMDLNDQWARRAREKGAKLVISTDAHHTSNFQYMKLGVDIARRAWCRPENILNTGKWEKIEEFKKSKLKIANVKMKI